MPCFLNLPTINCRYPKEHEGADYVQGVEYCQPEHQVMERLGAGLQGENNDAGYVSQYSQTAEENLKESLH